MTYGRPTANSTSGSLTRQTGTLGGQPTEAHEGPVRLRQEPPLFPGPREAPSTRSAASRCGAWTPRPRRRSSARRTAGRRRRRSGSIPRHQARMRSSAPAATSLLPTRRRPRRPRSHSESGPPPARPRGDGRRDPALKAGDAVDVSGVGYPVDGSTSSPRRATSSTRTDTGRTSSSAAVRTAP